MDNLIKISFPCVSKEKKTPVLREHIQCERFLPFQICLQASCWCSGPLWQVDLLSAALQGHLDGWTINIGNSHPSIEMQTFTSKKVRSRSCFCSFRLPRVEIHVKKISNQASRLPSSRNDGGTSHLCVTVRVRSTSWQHPLQSHFALDEGRGRFVVNRGERGNVADEFIKQGWL